MIRIVIAYIDAFQHYVRFGIRKGRGKPLSFLISRVLVNLEAQIMEKADRAPMTGQAAYTIHYSALR